MLLPVKLNEQIADDLYKQIKWMPLKNKVFVIGYLIEMILNEDPLEHHGFKRLWEKYEKSKLIV